jgi:DNA polymerase III alpha subunit
MINKIIIVSLLVVFCSFPLINSSGEEGSSAGDSDKFVEVTIKELVSNPKTYNGQRVMLDGFVDKVEYTKSSKGEPFTFFRMNDGNDNEVRVYYEDEHLSLSKGEKVKIKGRYKKEKRYLFYKIKNVIKARTVEKS